MVPCNDAWIPLEGDQVLSVKGIGEGAKLNFEVNSESKDPKFVSKFEGLSTFKMVFRLTK